MGQAVQEDGMVVVAEEVHEAEGGQVVGEMVVAVVVMAVGATAMGEVD